MSAAAKRAHREWTTEVIARAFTCEIQQFIPHICGGGFTDAAHVLRKGWIKSQTNTWSEQDQLAAMFDLRNGLCACRTGHDLFDAPGHGGVTIDDLPSVVVDFADEHGWLWKLELDYPADEQVAA